jgi:glucosyl-3-phosphoglycerate synthase
LLSFLLRTKKIPLKILLLLCSYYIPDVILVDAYSTDKTIQLAERAGAIIIQQPTKIFPAKGLAMKAGLREAFEWSADIVVFLDADIKDLTTEWVDKLVKALIDDNCDMSRGFYTRHARDAAGHRWLQ